MEQFFRIESDIWALDDLSFLEAGILQHLRDLIRNSNDHSPTADYLSRTFRVSKNTIRRRVVSLEEKGHITISHITAEKKTRWYFEVTQNGEPKEMQDTQNGYHGLPKLELRDTQNGRPINKTTINKEHNNIEQHDFDAIWKEYPRKVGKAKAFSAFKKAKNKPSVDKIIEIVRTHASSIQWNKDNKQFIPHLSSWLNGERWEDELEQPTPDKMDIMRIGKCIICGTKDSLIDKAGRCDKCTKEHFNGTA